MKARALVTEMAVTAVAGFVAAAASTWLYSWIAHGAPEFDWETAFELGIVLGIAVPVARVFGTKLS